MSAHSARPRKIPGWIVLDTEWSNRFRRNCRGLIDGSYFEFWHQKSRQNSRLNPRVYNGPWQVST